MSEEINQILEMLAARYGTTVTMLMQEIIRRGIVLNLIGFIITSLALCFAIIATVHFIKKYFEDPWDDGWLMGIIFIGSIAIVFGFIWFFFLTKLIGWVVSPHVQAIATIMDMIKY